MYIYIHNKYYNIYTYIHTYLPTDIHTVRFGFVVFRSVFPLLQPWCNDAAEEWPTIRIQISTRSAQTWHMGRPVPCLYNCSPSGVQWCFTLERDIVSCVFCILLDCVLCVWMAGRLCWQGMGYNRTCPRDGRLHCSMVDSLEDAYSGHLVSRW